MKRKEKMIERERKINTDGLRDKADEENESRVRMKDYSNEKIQG
jgi:hypothetical protein